MPVTTVSYYTYVSVEDDVKGININDYTSKSQGWIAIYLPVIHEMSSIYYVIITDNF